MKESVEKKGTACDHKATTSSVQLGSARAYNSQKSDKVFFIDSFTSDGNNWENAEFNRSFHIIIYGFSQMQQSSSMSSFSSNNLKHTAKPTIELFKGEISLTSCVSLPRG